MGKSIYTKLLRRFGTPPTGKEKSDFAMAQQETIGLQTRPLLRAGFANQIPADIVIVGGGFAGLSAAYYLKQSGHKVTVLEARDRLGGRVYSNRDTFANGQIIEFGAELIGANHPLWVSLAKEFGLSFNVVTSDEMFDEAGLTEPMIIDGEQLSDDDIIALFNNMKSIFECFTPEMPTIDAVRPWLSERAEQRDNTPLSAWFDEKIAALHLPAREALLLKLALDAEFANNNVVPCNKQSLLGVLTQVKAGGDERYWSMTEVYRCSSGNDMLATKMAEAIGYENIKMETQAVEIILQEKQAVVVTAQGKYVGDYVILATPPTVWADISMEPEILHLRGQTGPAVKYMSAVRSRFWITKGVAPSGLCGKLGMTWEGTDNQGDLPGRLMDLSCFSGAGYADHVLKMTQTERTRFYDTELESVFEGYNDAVKYRHFQNWPEEKFTKTGYSFPGLGQVCTIVKSLNQPYKRMYFAGEHTCPGFWGYMEGALQSGLLAARHIDESNQIT